MKPWVQKRLARFRVESKDANRALPPESDTFRISGIPLDWDRDQLRSFLASHENISDTTVKSLAQEANVNCQTATVTFKETPLQFRTGASWHIRLLETANAQLVEEQHVAVDRHFHGITTLYAPPASDHKIE